MIGNLGTTTGGATWAQGDFNGDGDVSVLGDVFVLVGHLGQSVIPPVAGELATTSFAAQAVSLLEGDNEDQKRRLPTASTQGPLAGSLAIGAAFEDEDL